MTRPTKLQELALSCGVEEGELFQPSGNPFQRADMVPRGRDSRFPPLRAHPWPPIPGNTPCGAPSRVTRAPPARGLPRRPPSLATPRPSLQGSAVPCRPGLPRVPCAPAGYPVVPCPGPPRAHTSRVPLSPPVLAYPAALTPGLHRAHPSRAPPPWPRPGLPPRPPLRTPPPPSLPVSPVPSGPGRPPGLAPAPRPGLARPPPRARGYAWERGSCI